MPSKKIPADALNKALLSELARGVQKTFENAEELFKEACLLKKNGALSRVLFLHQISLEECAKIEILGAYATSLLLGKDVNLAKLKSVLISHARKNRTNAYFLDVSAEEKAARQNGDFKSAVAIFSKIQTEFHTKSNIAKNASLYVDFKDGKSVTPRECITPKMVAEIASLNERYLGLMYPKMEMLSKWEKAPEEISETLVQFKNRANELRSELSDDPLKAMETLMQEMFEIELAKRK